VTRQHHIGLSPDDLAGNGGRSRYVLLPGSPLRAAVLGAHLEDTVHRPNDRGFDAYLGRLSRPGQGEPIDVLSIASGVGSASTEVVVRELLACGARRLLRVGSCGSMSPQVEPGQVVIVSGAVRDEDTSRHYAPLEYPAVAHPRALTALSEGARRAGLVGDTFVGLCHSKASLYAREFGQGPAGEANMAYTAWLRRCGVLASEMEASTLLILASTFEATPWPLAGGGNSGCQAGAVLAVFARDDSEMRFDRAIARQAEERAIRIALEGVRAWCSMDEEKSARSDPGGETP
jgi:uridine phosphorylase